MKIAGLPVIDATKKLTISITAKDVAKGNSKHPSSCAAAQACLRLPNCTLARVHLGRTYLKMGNKWVRYLTPKSMRTEIVAFDRGAKFQPGAYTFSAMQPSHRASGKTQGSKKLTKKGPAKTTRTKYHLVSGVRPHGASR